MQPTTPAPETQTGIRANESEQNRNPDVLLHEVIQRIGNPRWDLFIVGDGSGSGWDGAAGWASTLIDNNQQQARRFFYGACNSGSVNFAETMPYLQAMTWYDAHFGKELLKQKGTLHVCILTDSQVIANWGNKAATTQARPPRKMRAYWAGLRDLRMLGYTFQFYWAPRMTTALNWAADLMAGLTRQEVIKAANPEYIRGENHAERAAAAVANLVFYDPETNTPLNPYNVNP